ncbi:MAG: right-handed parallel beta-helix repeat-containing protein [Armatimonadota bacterium]
MQTVEVLKTICFGAALVFALSACGAAALAKQDSVNFYVAASGSDTWSGKLAAPGKDKSDGPFATIERARDEIRKLKTAGFLTKPVTVHIRGGIYKLPETLRLSSEDSGTVKAPVVYRAYLKENPVIIGGRTIFGWTRYKGGILKADVSSQGFKDIYFRQLFFDGKRQILARYPNYDHDNPVTGGWLYMDGDKIPMYQDIANENLRTFKYKPEDRRDWTHPEEVEVMVFPRYNWWNNLIPIASIDRETRTVTLARDASYGNRLNDRYFYQNSLEELDAPGEWYLDKNTWTVYFWPPSDISKGAVYAPFLQTLIEMKDVSHVTFQGLTLECADGSALILQNCTNCLVAGNTIRNVSSHVESGESAIAINGGRNNGAVGNNISEVGGNAISLGGGDFNTLEPAKNYADNNYIHHVGIYYKQGVGVAVSGVGNRVSHNLIHDCPRFGISWGGNDHLFEYNHIRHCTLETGDTGAIYSWQVDWTKRGTIMRYNYLHDIIGFGQENGKWIYPYMNWGIYLDDGTCGTHVYGNIVARTVLGGVHYHGGRDNVVENNILIDGRDSQVQFSGYVEGGHPVPMLTDAWNKFSGTPAYDKYLGYSELKQSLKDAWQMAGNKFCRNIVSYTNPKAKMYAYYSLPFDKTDADYNLIWHKNLPILTGTTVVKGDIGQNLAVNPSFEDGVPDEMPASWEWQIQPKGSIAAADTQVQHDGKQSLRFEGRGTTTDSSGQTLTPSLLGTEIPVIPGQTYRLRVYVKAAEPNTAFGMIVQSYIPNTLWWGKGMNEKAGTEWKEYEAVLKFPAPGDSDYRPEMKTFRIRIDVMQDKGIIWIDDIRLHKVEVLDEWESWKSFGLDKHSVIADPMFVNPAKDDYRLKPNSPAFALGFKPIPVDKIGPYKSELRATWPIKEAVGAREQMKVRY